ncbi:hypothetical protein BH09PSE6_BH09PSE6_02350 [soil metagenome]
MRAITPITRRLVPISAALVLAACATAKPDVQWIDPGYVGKSMVGKKVLVSCDAPDSVQARICTEKLSDQVTSLGATAVVDGPSDTPGPKGDAALLASAKRSSASAIFTVTLAPDASVVKPGPSIGIGIGGFGGNVGGGLGLSKSLGAGEVLSGLAGVGNLVDVAAGKSVWSARVHTEPSDKLDEQIAKVTDDIVKFSRQAGVF